MTKACAYKEAVTVSIIYQYLKMMVLNSYEKV